MLSVLLAIALTGCSTVTDKTSKTKIINSNFTISENGGVDQPTQTFMGVEIHRSTPEAAVKEFLTRYFNDMLAGNTDWGWNSGDNSQYDGLIEHTDEYYNKFCMMKQYIDYIHIIADTNDGYSIEQAIGRFASLRLNDTGLYEDRLPDAEYVYNGYFNTTAFGTFVICGLSKHGDCYTITSVEFPDWPEYNNFCTDFERYMKKNNWTDYNKSVYVDQIREESEATKTSADEADSSLKKTTP